jgi:Domain of unknown function (DUF5625)
MRANDERRNRSIAVGMGSGRPDPEFVRFHSIMRILSVGFLFLCVLLAGCGPDMKPARPYAVPFNIEQAGHTATIDIEALEDNVGVALDLVFYLEDSKQRNYLLNHVGYIPIYRDSHESERKSVGAGIVVPIQVLVKDANQVIFQGLILTQGSYSLSGATPGYINRNIWGKVLSKGKYRIELTNVEAQPLFKGYRTEIKIPGDRKV